MKADEKRSHRVNLLAKIWMKTDKNEDAVIQRALQMGVTMPTAMSYLNQIKMRYPK